MCSKIMKIIIDFENMIGHKFEYIKNRVFYRELMSDHYIKSDNLICPLK